jgi:hypothetical protein
MNARVACWITITAVLVMASSTFAATPQKSAIRFDGLYHARDAEGWHHYFRFYSDGTVASTTSSGTAAQVAKWLRKQLDLGGNGTYTVARHSIRMRIHVRGGDIDYWGTVEGGQLQLRSHSQITDYRDSLRYTFVAVHFGRQTPNQSLEATAGRCDAQI